MATASDGEGSPPRLDPPSHEFDNDTYTTSTFGASLLPDITLPEQREEPPSPGTARKRTIEEIYEKSTRSRSSTTPLKTPPRASFPLRLSDSRPKSSQFEKLGFSSVIEPHRLTMSTSIADKPSKVLLSEQRETKHQSGFGEDITAYQQHLEDEFKDYENGLKSRDRSQELQSLNWEELEGQYQEEIGPRVADEQQIMEEVHVRFQQFLLWMKVSGEKESERAVKRLRTRVAFVQNSEGVLAQRQDHYGKVLNAFQDAMALLENA